MRVCVCVCVCTPRVLVGCRDYCTWRCARAEAFLSEEDVEACVCVCTPRVLVCWSGRVRTPKKEEPAQYVEV